ncbi:MAG: endonuclease/exonuclease/phosphatase family protein [Nitriliruptor sp.]
MRHRRVPLRVIAWPYAALTVVVIVLWLAQLRHPAAQVLDLATFWGTVPAVVLLVVAVLARDGKATLLLAVPAAVWIWSYGGAFLPSTPPEVGADLRVATFNTFVGAPDEGHVLALVEQEDPDVLLLQEVFPPREEALLAALGQRYPHHRIDRSEGVGAVVVMSRHPIVDVIEVGDASDRSRATSVVELDVDGVSLQVVSLHLISPCPGCGPSLIERLELEDDVRRAEVGAVLEVLDPALPAVVGGDLNSGDRSSAYRRLVAAGFTDPQRDAGSGMGFTWPADGQVVPPLVRIDWVLARALTAVDARVVAAEGSDHRAVVVDLAIDR